MQYEYGPEAYDDTDLDDEGTSQLKPDAVKTPRDIRPEALLAVYAQMLKEAKDRIVALETRVTALES